MRKKSGGKKTAKNQRYCKDCDRNRSSQYDLLPGRSEEILAEGHNSSSSALGTKLPIVQSPIGAPTLMARNFGYLPPKITGTRSDYNRNCLYVCILRKN